MRFKYFFAVLAATTLAQAAFAQDPVPAAPPPAAPAAPAPPPVNTAIPAIAPDPATDLANILYLDLSNGGRVTIQLRPDVAPGHVARIKTLASSGFYNNIVFHRVIDGFMAQTGDPTGTGEGDSDLPDLTSEFNLYPHLRGTVSMARTADPNSANSQFFIMFMPRKSLDRKYTAFGRVIAGIEHVDSIERGEPPANPTRIVRASLAAAGPVTAAPPAMIAPPTAQPKTLAAPPPTTGAAIDAAAAQPDAAPNIPTEALADSDEVTETPQ